ASGTSIRATALKFGIPKSTLCVHLAKCGDGPNRGLNKPPPRSLLNRAVEDKVVDATKNGCYAWVAAERAGISCRTFFRWMKQGEDDDAAGNLRSPFRRFWLRVREAHATARFFAEGTVLRNRPLEWLRYGPGRERPGEPGWTDGGLDLPRDSGGNAFVLVLQGGGAPKVVPVVETTAKPALPGEGLESGDEDDRAPCAIIPDQKGNDGKD